MKNVIQLLAVGTVAVLAALSLSSCGCCSGEAKPPALRPLPQFQEVPTIQPTGK